MGEHGIGGDLESDITENPAFSNVYVRPQAMGIWLWGRGPLTHQEKTPKQWLEFQRKESPFIVKNKQFYTRGYRIITDVSKASF